MKYTQKLALRFTLISFLLSGCTEQMPLENSRVLVPPSTTSWQSLQDVQSLSEMQLVMMFQGLIRMDRQNSLTITAKQAQAILPVVRKSMDEGSISEFERKQVIAGLTQEQRTFLDEISKQMMKRMTDRMDNLSDEVNSEEREKRVAAFIQKRKAERQLDAGMKDRANGENQLYDPRNMGVSVERQLVELLVSKHD